MTLSIRNLTLAALVAAGLILTSTALWIPAKARLAQWLLADAWAESLDSGTAVKPWPWADHWPVARLSVPDMDIDQIVLAGDGGSSLAFGPGENMQAHAMTHAARIISGHRDTHFSFLRNIQPGQTLILSDHNGNVTYQVDQIQVVDSAVTRLLPSAFPDGLILVTCYPFDALTAGGTQRLVVMASAVEPEKLPAF